MRWSVQDKSRSQGKNQCSRDQSVCTKVKLRAVKNKTHSVKSLNTNHVVFNANIKEKLIQSPN